MFEASKEHFGFLSNIKNPFWNGKVWEIHEQVSLDGGVTEIATKNTLMMGMYFFVAENRVEHSRQVYTFS